MDKEEQDWIQAAMAECGRATEKKLAILLVRHQDANDQHDVVVTNCTESPSVLELLIKGIYGCQNPESSD